MNYIDDLRKELEMYLNSLIEYKNTDYGEAWNIVSEASRSALSFYEGTILPLEHEEEIVSDALCEIVKFNELVGHIKSLVMEDAIRRNYQKLLKIREVVGKAFPNGVSIKDGENEVVVATELLKKRQAEAKEKRESLEEWQEYDYRNLSHYYTSPLELLKAGKLKTALIPIAFCGDTFQSKKYSNLIQFLTLLTLRADCADCCPNFGKNFSIVFREEFSKFRSSLRRGNRSNRLFCEKIFETLSNEYTIGENGNFILFSDDYKKSLGFVILKENFIRDLLKILEKNQECDLFDLIKCVYDIYGEPDINDYYQDAIKELIRLYRETPEQILITEQRYYQEKQLEQLQENARLEREMMEEQAELDRQEQAYQEEQNRRQMERDRISRENAEREYMRKMDEERRKAEEQARRDKREQQRVEDRARYKQSMEDGHRRNQQMHLCWKCANYGHGCRGGIVACGNFRAKSK